MGANVAVPCVFHDPSRGMQDRPCAPGSSRSGGQQGYPANGCWHASGLLNTIHQRVTASPGARADVSTLADTPWAVRTSVEVPTTLGGTGGGMVSTGLTEVQ